MGYWIWSHGNEKLCCECSTMTISIKEYLLKFKVDILSIIGRKMRDEEVQITYCEFDT